MKIPLAIIILLVFVIYPELFAQDNRGDIRILFYNVENLFDTANNPAAGDDEFTPEGARHWGRFRLEKKINNIAKVIIAAGGWENPEIVGLCEVENRYVVEQLINETVLSKSDYKIIHKESPDHRGIDVSLLYKSEKFKPLKYDCFAITTDKGEVLPTREILYVSGIVNNTDTLHLFMNHWPSRYSGYLETVGLRKLAAKILKGKTNELLSVNPYAKIIIMGDFNDQPSDESINNVLMGHHEKCDSIARLTNLSSLWHPNKQGTIKYRSQWFVYDQVIVSQALVNSNESVYTMPQNCSPARLAFLYASDKKYGGNKLFRTYNGYRYVGGFSDHLPVYLDLFFR